MENGSKFPATRWSVLEAIRGRDPAEQSRALDTLFAAYWKPVYKYVRLRWNRAPEDAQDLTQGFFADPEVSYERLATEYAIPVTDVTNALSWARREFRRIA